ncbi:MAG: class I SAM-dependent methyltransferase [Vicinamibacterales bacterium]
MNPWSDPGTVAGFVQSPPNAALLRFAEGERARGAGMPALDIGCGAARNTLPLAHAGWDVLGTDSTWPMLAAAARRSCGEPLHGRLRLAPAAMDRIGWDPWFSCRAGRGLWRRCGSPTEDLRPRFGATCGIARREGLDRGRAALGQAIGANT